jgi:hypothetical protein
VAVGYRGKTAEQVRARELRALAWTYDEIAAELGVSKGSVSLWVRDVEFVARPRRTARKRGPNKLERAKLEEIARLKAEGVERIGRLSERELLVAGAALYAGEGAKTDGCVTFANCDPRMIHFFMTWIRRCFDIDESRLRLRLYLHVGLDLEVAVSFWSELTDIPESQFTKPYRAVADPSIRKSKHPMGCPGISYGCSRTHRSVMGLVHALLSCPVADPG